jgi:cytochrome d ubiquinol oxidase subunit I
MEHAVTDLLAARSQMAMSLAFHIVFAVVGIAMPVLMCLAEGRWLRTGDPIYRQLARQWAKGTAVLFAVGAVSGTVLSFELGLLWPGFMAYAGPIIGMPFSLEGFAFFLEAIFLGIYLYGWERVPPRVHWLSGWGVAASGALSGVFVVTANAWMNAPSGFELVDGKPQNIDPIAAMLNPAAFTQVFHMMVAAYVAVGFGVAGVHAWMLLKHPGHPFHRAAYGIALTMGGVAALLAPISGDLSAKMVARTQPVKFAAIEAHWETTRGASLVLGGWVDEQAEQTRWAIEIPYLLSLLAANDPWAEIKGLKEWPRADRPPVAIVHWAFDLMVGIGVLLAAMSLLAGWLAWRRRQALIAPGFLRLVVFCGPLGMIAIEAGWTVTEVGRQPWVVQGYLRTAEAVTPMPWLWIPFTLFTLLYLMLAAIVIVLLRRQVAASTGDAARAWP